MGDVDRDGYGTQDILISTWGHDEGGGLDPGSAYVIQRVCNAADENGTCLDEDCDDTNAGVHPGAVEVAGDGIDQDCDNSDIGGEDGKSGFPQYPFRSFRRNR